MPRGGFIIVAVDEYPHDFYGPLEHPLHCAVADAERIRDWIAVSFADELFVRSICLNGEATLERIRTEFSNAASKSGVEFFLVYLAGHARRNDQGTWFCTADDQRIDPPLLDSLLSNIHATDTLVIVDSCYSEGLVEGCAFFSRIAGVNSRTFIASSRFDQLSYEDVKLVPGMPGSSLLATALLEVIINHQRAGARSVILEKDILPYLRARVPTLAFRLKSRAQQEPVTGGGSCGEVRIPLAPGYSGPPSVFAGLLARWRSLVGLTAAVVTLGVIAIYLVTWHFAVTSDGEIGVFYGPSWLPSFAGNLLLRAELPLIPDNLAADKEIRSKLLSRRVDGVWLQVDGKGRRRWQQLRDSLGKDLSAYWSALQGDEIGDIDRWEYNSTEFLDRPSWDYKGFGARRARLIAFSARAVLDGDSNNFKSLIAYIFADSTKQNFDEAACASGSSYGYVEWHEGRNWNAISGLLASTDDPKAFPFVLFEARVLDILLRGERPRLADQLAPRQDYIILVISRFRHLVESYTKGRIMRGLSPMSSDDLNELSKLRDSGCGMMADLIRGWLSRGPPNPELLTRLIGHLRARDRYGQRAETVGSLLLDEIASLASLLPVDHAWSIFDQASAVIDDPRKVFRAALSLASRVGLPGGLQDAAFTVLERWPLQIDAVQTKRENYRVIDYGRGAPGAALVLLSNASSAMNEQSRDRFVALMDHFERIAQNRSDIAPIQNSLTAYAVAIASLGIIREDQLSYLFSARGGGNGERDVVGSLEEALARLALKGFKDPRLLEGLFHMRSAPPGSILSDWDGAVPARDYNALMVAARAAIRFREVKPDPDGLQRELLSLRGNMTARRSLVLMVQEFLRERPAAIQLEWYRSLKHLRTVQIEPEVRADLGDLAVRIFDIIKFNEIRN